MTALALNVLKFLFSIGPLLFGIGFLAPVLAELMVAAGLHQPLGLEPIMLGGLLGLSWGSYALIKGSWV